MLVEIIKIIKLKSGDKELLAKVTQKKCVGFLKALKDNLDVEVDVEVNLEDFIEIMKNCQTTEAIKKYINVECAACLTNKTMNKVIIISNFIDFLF